MNCKDEEDETQAFKSRVLTLKCIALDLTDEIKQQNAKLSELQPTFQNSIHKIMGNIKQIHKSNPKQFRAWLYFIGGGIGLVFIIFVFFVST